MAKRKTRKQEYTQDELKQMNLERELKDLTQCLAFIPEPTYKFNIGDEVDYGFLEDIVVVDILENGKIYEVDFTSIDNNWGNPIRHEHQRRYVQWTSIRKKNENKSSLIKNDDIRLSYFQTHLSAILSKTYSLGVDFDPEYQREYVWDLEDKFNLIDSIFNNVDIGKFVFIQNGCSDDKLYQVLDGKQRMRAILDYYEDRFLYQGYYYSDLSHRDKNHFTSYSINVSEVEDLTREQILRYFIKLNTGGRIMAKEQIDKVKKMLDEIEEVK